MNAGEECLRWLYKDQLRIDAQWSEQLTDGFRWWADEYAQAIRIIGTEQDDDVGTGWLISVRTECLFDIELTDDAARIINERVLPFCSLAAPTYKAESKRLVYRSLVRVHAENVEWMKRLIGIASVIQLSEASENASRLETLIACKKAVGGHPDLAVREQPDELASAVEALIIPVGQQPIRWSIAEFEACAETFAKFNPDLIGRQTDGFLELVVPFGERISSTQITTLSPHPRYGNGLFLLQSFPLTERDQKHGARLAFQLNEREFTRSPFGYGFGSYCYSKDSLCFVTFVPNVAYNPILLQSLALAACNRAIALMELVDESGRFPVSM